MSVPVHDSPTLERGTAAARTDPRRLDHLRQAIEHAEYLLPTQGPINVFIHHNTLHAFEDLPFEEAVIKGSKVYGCRPYLPEDRYREMLAAGRIHADDLQAVLRDDLGKSADEPVLALSTRFELRQAMLLYPQRTAPLAELRWFVAETDALRRVRLDAPEDVRKEFVRKTRQWALKDLRDAIEDPKAVRVGPLQRTCATLAEIVQRFGHPMERWSDAAWEAFSLQALWRIARHGVHGVKAQDAPPATPVRHRDWLLAVTGEDTDRLVHEVLIPFCGAFLDQGLDAGHCPIATLVSCMPSVNCTVNQCNCRGHGSGGWLEN
jgi:hypothetical protein